MAGNEVYGRDSVHDDLVLSVAMPLWLGSLPMLQMSENARSDEEATAMLRPREAVALTAEQAVPLEAAEFEAIENERRGNCQAGPEAGRGGRGRD